MTQIGKLILPQRGAIDIYDWTDGRLYDLTGGKQYTGNKDLYDKSPWAYACAHLRATELSNIPFYIMKGDKRLKRHKLYNMLEDFGEENNYVNSIYSTELDLCQWGAAFWYRDYDKLSRLNPQTIEVKPTEHGGIKFKQYLNGKLANTFQRQEIVYFREYHPDLDLHPGVPVYEIVKGPINTEIVAEKMIKAFFQNDAVPGLMLSTDQIVPEKEAGRIRDWFNKVFRGPSNKGKVGVADRGLTPIKVANNFEESQLMSIRDQARNDICVGFRVPKILVGSMDEALVSTAVEARKLMIEDLIIPRIRLYQNFINQDLTRNVDKDAKVVYAPEELAIMQEDLNSKWERIKEAIETGVITAEYGAEVMGYPKTAIPDDKERVPRKQWESKAMKAFSRGESPNVEFETDLIPVDRQYQIRGRLQNATCKEDIQGAFR